MEMYPYTLSMGTHPILLKGDNLSDFLFASMEGKLFPRESTLTGANSLFREEITPTVNGG